MSRTRAPNPQRANTTRTETTADGQPPSSNFRITGTLRLRADRTETETGLDTDTAEERHIRWAEDVVDNEGQGKKSSKGGRPHYLTLGAGLK
jgi:protein phosphatase 1 regulatory subunit 11